MSFDNPLMIFQVQRIGCVREANMSFSLYSNFAVAIVPHCIIDLKWSDLIGASNVPVAPNFLYTVSPDPGSGAARLAVH